VADEALGVGLHDQSLGGLATAREMEQFPERRSDLPNPRIGSAQAFAAAVRDDWHALARHAVLLAELREVLDAILAAMAHAETAGTNILPSGLRTVQDAASVATAGALAAGSAASGCDELQTQYL